MYLRIGTKKLKHKEIWFLSDIKGFQNRKLYIFEDFIKTYTVLEEESIDSGEVFSQRNSGKTARSIMDRERLRINYTSEDIKVKKGKPFGWVYGLQKEIHNKKGEIVEIKEYSCDFYGQKELLKG